MFLEEHINPFWVLIIYKQPFFVTTQHPNRGAGLYYKSNFSLIFLAISRTKTKNKKHAISTS